MHGDVGAGKTLLLDLFADAVATDAAATRARLYNATDRIGCADDVAATLHLRRVHFNAFIHECHRRLHAHSQALAAQIKEERARDARIAAASTDAQPDAYNAAASPVAPPASSGKPRAWDAVAELVRRLVAERSAPEGDSDLHAALDRVSYGILSNDERAAGASRSGSIPTSSAASATPSAIPQLVDDPEGRPVSAGVLCFDEVQMMDVADATIVAGVLSRLFDAGWVLVATCNRTPEEFASSVMHREHPQARFTKRVTELCETAHLRAPIDANGTSIDYRTVCRPAEEATYLHPLGRATARELDERFHALGGEHAAPSEAALAHGRSMRVLSAPEHGLARISFAELCDSALGAADYIALAQQFHTLVLTDVPQLSLRERDQARRFITLVDQLYNHRTKLITSAAVPLASLFLGQTGANGATALQESLEGLEFEGEAGKAAELNPIGVTANSLAPSRADYSDTARVGADSRKLLVKDSLFTGEDEIFAFRRAVSRLTEMQSLQYLNRAGAARPQYVAS